MLLPSIPIDNGPNRLKDILSRLGVTSTILLDAADPASYPGSGTQWLDLSGNNYHFLLGSTGSGTDAPVFTGTAGNRDAYFALDGTQFFKLNQANPAAIDNLHKANTIFTVLMFHKIPGSVLVDADTSGGIYGLYGTTGGSYASTIGLHGSQCQNGVNVPSQEPLIIAKGSSPPAYSFKTGTTTPHQIHPKIDEYEFLGMSLNAVTGEFALVSNDELCTESGVTLTSPSASSASAVLGLYARGGNGNDPAAPGTQVAAFALIAGTALSLATMKEIGDSLRRARSRTFKRRKGLRMVSSASVQQVTSMPVWPQQAQAGDVILAFNLGFTSGGIPTTPTAPSGWVASTVLAGTNHKMWFLAKALTAADLSGSPQPPMMTGATNGHWAYLVYRDPERKFTSVALTQSNAQIIIETAAGNLTPQTISLGGKSGPLLGFSVIGETASDAIGSVVLTGVTERQIAQQQYQWLAGYPVHGDDVAPSDITLTYTKSTFGGSNYSFMFSGYLTLT